MATILNIKGLFRNSKEPQSDFKHAHFLNTLSPEQIEEIVLFSESDRVSELLPELENKKVLFLNDNKHKFIFKKILAREPQTLINCLCAPSDVRSQETSGLTIFGDRNNLPFKANSFDVVVCPLALQPTALYGEQMKGLSRILKNGGRLIVTNRHPQLDYLLLNQNPAQAQICEESITKQFRLLRDNHLFTEDLVEGVVDLSLKPFFCMEGEHDFYHDYKGTPVTAAFKAVKYVRGRD